MTAVPPVADGHRPGPRGRWALAGPFGSAALLAAALAWVLTHNPTDAIPDPSGGCLWTALTGTQGPTCGGTRMVWHLMHGNLAQAARHHLPALLAVPFVIYAWARWAAHAAGRQLPAAPLPRWLMIAYGASWMVFAVVRNLPWPPFTWLHLTDIQ
ncbi:DUF2752 domain-containing protein [Micromonospora endolithica]|uniref:DUF2752 domain-containing protein n=1 Tax=Micromonospora endolithica TaxID=230091 RepID=A0A3A9ZQ10_9ACTN|nr:DUF2752 domain-containing protein [Micromonospora endolithica]RKN50312.1 DUF2752 domain-containing protein [Micromonospora endolithica]TWJ21033.1 uncharacterized protein DUF2752 [Micromonospora endolithica]